MKSIWIFGNVTKDVYINMLGDQSYERDENGVDWLNLGFSSEEHFYGEKSEVFGGAAVTKEVLENFGLSAKILDEDGSEDYRYILMKDDGVAYFANRKRSRTDFVEPEDAAAIFVDRSAGLNWDFVEKIKDYKGRNPRVPLIVYLNGRSSEFARELGAVADFVFLESGDFCGFNKLDMRKICILSEKSVKFGNFQVYFDARRQDKLTHLTFYNVLAATVIAGIFTGRDAMTTLKLAKTNIENIRLDGTLGVKKLEEILEMNEQTKIDLKNMAKLLVGGGKGILAADESGGSIHKKFEGMGIPDDEQHRRDYRNVFFTTPGLEKYVNGVILFDETAKQRSDDGKTFTEFLTGLGVVPGIKVDQGLVNFSNSEEKYTNGLDGLRERLHEYYKAGLRFAKWRAAFEVTEGTPSDFAINENCKILAQYALDCQTEGIVPIVEPEVVFDGDYSLKKSKEVTGRILRKLFECLREKNVELGATILKVNMCIAGKRFPVQSTSAEVGEATTEVLRENVPKELAGVVFLSGGQTVEQATENLRAVIKNEPFPWPVTFSFARALQEPALTAWRGDNANVDAAREGFLARLVANCEALRG